MKKLTLFFGLMLISYISAFTQNCLTPGNLISGKGTPQFMKNILPNRIVVGGVYYTSTQGVMTMDTVTLSPRAGDVLTIFAAVLDSNLTPIHVFNVIGFTETGGSFNDTRIWDMHADAAGNIYFSGSYTQDTLLSYFGDTIISDTYQEGFIIRCDTLGQTTLLKSFGSRQWNTNYTFEDRAYAICSDPAGNIYVSSGGEGRYFQINGDTVNSTNSFSSVNYGDIFVFSLFPNGTTRWLKAFGTSNRDDAAYDIDVNSFGEVALSGGVEGSNTLFQFGPLSHIYRYSQYGVQGFVGKLDSTGTPLWLSPIEVYYPTGPDVGAYAVAIDDSGFVYSSGYFDAWALFNGDTIRSLYNTSNYFSKYGISGQTLFVKLGNIDTFYPYPIYMDENKGKIIISGQTFTNQLTFQQYGQCCSTEAYLVVYDSNGNVQWLRGAKSVNSSNPYFGMACLNENGTAYVCGTGSGGTVEIAPLQIPINTNKQYFIVKFSPSPSNGLSLSITNNGSNPVTCGTFTQLIPTVSPSSGPRLTWWANNDTIATPNFVTTLNASPKLNTLYIATAFYNGCVVSDSIEIAVSPLIVDAGFDQLICEGAPTLLNGSTLQNATYSWSPSNAVSDSSLAQTQFVATQSTLLTYTVTRAGCSSSDDLSVTVLPLPDAAFSFANNLLTVDFTALSTNSNNSYWSFGDSSAIDSGNVAQHTYSQNGIYTACLYSVNLCGTDSSCQTINLSTVGVTVLKDDEQIMRNENGYSLKAKTPIQSAVLMGIQGNVIETRIVHNRQLELDFNGLAKGMYILKLKYENEERSLRLIW